MSDVGDLRHSTTLSQEDRARAEQMRAKLYEFAAAHPHSPDGQRASGMVKQLDQRLGQAFADPAPKQGTETPLETGVRHFADSATFGGAGKLGDAIAGAAIPDYNTPDADATTPRDLVHQEEARGDVANQGAAFLGEVGGAALPVSGPGLMFKAAGVPFRALQGGSAVGRVAAGTARGVGQSALGAPAVAGTRALVSSDAPTVGDRLTEALAAMKEQATSPLTYGAGAAFGAAEGGANALRQGHTQTGRDIRLVEDTAKGTATPLGPFGGYYNDPVLKGMHTDNDVGEVARRAGGSVQRKLNQKFSEAGLKYAGEKGAARAAGELDKPIDVNPLLQQAEVMKKSGRLTQSTKNALEAEVIKPLMDRITDPHHPTNMFTIEEFNDLKGKLGDLGHVNIPGDSTFQSRTFQELADVARTMRHTTAMAPIDRAYATSMDQLEEAHSAMGFRNKTHTNPEDVPSARRVANFVGRQGSDNITAGIQNEDARTVERLFPETKQELSAPEMLRAKQRMTPGLGTTGGLIGHVSGAVAHNVEPLAVGAYQLGKRATGAMAPTNAIANQLRNSMGAIYEAHDAENDRQASRVDAVKSGGKEPTFIDRIEDGKAVLLDGEKTRTVDVSSLPDGAKAGMWFKGGQIVEAPASESANIRKRLSAGDNGGRIGL